ncbi:MAG: non-ribosomal peptide synthetase, partial [Vicinamibacteria bacterium]
MSGDPTFVELLRRSREVALEAYEHQDLPFEKLVEELHPERQLSRNPLFQVMFGFQNVPELPIGLSGLSLSGFDIDRDAARFDLTLFVTESKGRLLCNLEYSMDLFDHDRIERLLRHFDMILAGIASSPESRLSELPLLPGEERRLLLEASNLRAAGPVGELASDAIHERFARQAKRRPNAVALTLPSESGASPSEMTYGALEASANRLAHHLIGCGVGPEVKVGICLDRSTSMVTAILAILKAGGAYVPLDPSYPDARLKFLVTDSAAPVLVTEKHLRSKLEGVEARVVVLDEERDAIAGRSPEPPGVDCHPEALAYVIYTSGSTGAPKGVGVSHGSVLRLFDETEPWYGFDEADVWTLFHSYAFDFSVWEIWGALSYGGRLVLVPHWLSRSPEDFHALLHREGVTVLNQTPSAFRQLSAVDAEKPEELRYVIFGGEALHPQDWRPWVERYGDSSPSLVNMFGITETTVHVTFRPLSRAD